MTRMPTKKKAAIRATRNMVTNEGATAAHSYAISWTDSKAGFPAALSEEIARLELLLMDLRTVAERYAEAEA